MPPTITVTLPGGGTTEVPFGTPISALIWANGTKPLAAVLNGEAVWLDTLLTEPARVAPILLTDRPGYAIYARSMCYLLALAAHEEFPGSTLEVEHTINNEIFATLDGDRSAGGEEVARLLARMRTLVASDEPIERVKVTRDEAVSVFTAQGMDDKVDLLASVTQPYVSLYRCRGYADYLFGPLVPSLGYLATFGLEHFDGGILLLLPDKQHPDDVAPRTDIPKLRATFRATERWVRILGVRNVGEINTSLAVDEGRDLILMSEALHEKEISKIADAVLADREGKKLILIAGPSSSGKTTFSKRLAIQLRVLGLEPFPIAADDYFVERARTPLDESGNPDFEALGAVDVATLNEHLTTWLSDGEVDLISFNFLDGSRHLTGQSYRMNPRSVLILEGIHGLDDGLTPSIAVSAKYRIYVSALTPLNMDDHTAIFVSDIRTLRRVIRDQRTRGRSAEETLRMWPSVRAGEAHYIFPYQENADVMFNSSLLYEINALKPYARPLLENINHNSSEYVEAARLLNLLKFFQPASERFMPGNSIIREFIGGSCFD